MKVAEQEKEHYRVLYEELCSLAEKTEDHEFAKGDKSSVIFQTYDLSQKQGQLFYRNVSDEQLLNVIKKRAQALNHSPAQKEIFWVWRAYIKERFQKWPYALEKAGLSKSAGARGKTLQQIKEEKQAYQILLQELQKKAELLCRIPHPQDVPELCERIKKYKKNWNDVITDAGFNHTFFQEKSVYIVKDLEKEYWMELEKIQKISVKLGRAPLKSEIEESIRKKLIQRCGSWRNALYQIGLEPIVRIAPFSSTNIHSREKERHRNHRQKLRDCYYKVLYPNEQMISDLKVLEEIKSDLNRIPERKEVPGEVRKRLLLQCGSWENVLFQIR